MMFLDVSKKPGDPDAVKTADEIVAENTHLRDLVQRLAQRLQMARLEGFGGPEREKLLDEAREAVGESIEAAAKREMAKEMSKKLDDNRVISNTAEMRKALERILDIEGYGAPWIEAKCIAQKALEVGQCTPPIAQETSKIEQSGNAAALRKALEDTEELLEHFAKPGTMLHSAFFLHMRDNRAALAEPPRNCDIGETDDQQYRFERLCNAFPYCTGCPVYKRWGKRPKSCGIIWAQMPYEKEGGAR